MSERRDVSHYTVGGIECIDYLKAKLTDAEFRGFLMGNVIKYLSRLSHKDQGRVAGAGLSVRSYC